ncbi:DegT/DnrJ/EryC1/StrS family aminotransferase [uncultured Sphingomonas sp.]|uniref:DegT/DnrJ/EryC1/StrS family aminotransferase n=1 Tax=uncultured Sphingomonas sp. TaxID=158754 RepID=UPI0035CB4752
MDLPLIRPSPPRLSTLTTELEAIEASGVYSNGGPVARGFEAEVTDQLFGGQGHCLAVANATLGLMIALRHAMLDRPRGRRLALMPAFTFAATAHAADWAGLTPLLADCDPDDWAIDARVEERMLAEYGPQIGAIIPYATFGNPIDLDRYAWISRRHDVAVVVDAASSLGSLDDEGRGFGAGCSFPMVYSMHATKTFATSEGGLIHCGDAATIDALRAMTNFGFVNGRSAELPGLNAKLAEIPALLATAKLREIESVARHRERLEQRYRRQLPSFTFQKTRGHRQTRQFMPVLLATALAVHRDTIIARLADEGIGAGTYFSPHLGEQPWFREHAVSGLLPVTDNIAARMLALPIADVMTIADVDRVAGTLAAICRSLPIVAQVRDGAAKAGPLNVVVIGGGPAGTALLCAASKIGQLDALTRAGIALVDREERIGGGQIGDYAITSDSTAETFLTADAALPAALSLVDQPVGRAIAEHRGALGVPLAKVGAYLDQLGATLARRITASGGEVLAGHEAIAARRGEDGLWYSCLRRRCDGEMIELASRHLVLATGGIQPAVRLAEEIVGGRSLLDQCGDRLVQSDAVLRSSGIDALLAGLPGNRPARIAIVGGSTSAVSVAARLLRGAASIERVTILHRRPLKIFYPSVDAARADGYSAFTPDDVCPLSGFVHRLGGLRLEARELALHALGIGRRASDPRLVLHRLDGPDDPAAGAVLAAADLVVAAFGYHPQALRLIDAQGRTLRLRSDGPRRGPMVDDRCRVVDPAGVPLPDVFGIGLAAGFRPSGQLGGEPSFRGQANGLWLWQNEVGRIIVEQLSDVPARATWRAA